MPYNETDKPCGYCGCLIPMPRKRDRVKDYCNRGCASRALLSAPVKPCPTCGKPTSTAQGARFCSKTCANRSRVVVHLRTCARCGNHFQLPNIAYERRGNGRYCSRSCATRVYNVNEHFFDDINSEPKAYWLGFLFADGYQNGSEMVVNLNARDEGHLTKFREALGSEHKVKLIPADDMTGGFKATFRVGSQTLCLGLNKWGCVQAKSLILRYPERLPEHLARHFIRGVFDGDGHIGVWRGYWHWCIYSEATPFIDEVEHRLVREGIRTTRSRSDGGKFVRVSNRDGIQQLKSYFYEGATVWLDRKRERFDQASP